MTDYQIELYAAARVAVPVEWRLSSWSDDGLIGLEAKRYNPVSVSIDRRKPNGRWHTVDTYRMMVPTIDERESTDFRADVIDYSVRELVGRLERQP